MANEKEDKMDVKKPPAPAPAPKAAEPPKPPPTQEELAKSYEELVARAVAAGHRDDPVVAKALDYLDRQPKKEGKDASHKG